MSLLDEVKKRVRPGSAGVPPASQTFLNTRHDERRAPREGISAPGASEPNVDSQAWSYILASSTNTSGQELGIRDLGDPEDPASEDFAPYQPDDPDVLRKLFGLQVRP